jgi:PAS domain S-box-containing protein
VTGSRFEPADFGIGQLFELIPEAVIIGDALTGEIVLWNDAAAEMFGYSADEAVGMLIETLVPPELRERHRAGLARFAATGTAPLVDGRGVIELSALHRDQRVLQIELRLNPLGHNPGGRPYVLAVIRDVSDRHELQEALRGFFSAAAHDLQQPITVLTGALDLLPSAVEGPEDMRDDLLGMARRQVDKLARLIDDIMAAARLEAGAVVCQPEDVELGAAIAAMVTEASELDVDVESAAGVVARVDPSHLERIVGNLLANAARYGTPPITVSCGPDGEGVRIDVRDAGPGPAPDVEPRLFRPFARSVTVSDIAGSGLGLAGVRRLAELNGGRAWYVKTADGPRFSVWLPAAQARATRSSSSSLQ